MSCPGSGCRGARLCARRTCTTGRAHAVRPYHSGVSRIGVWIGRGARVANQENVTADGAGLGGRVLADARLAFVGAGVMAEAMIAGLLARELVEPGQIVVSHPRHDRRLRLG